MESTFIQYIDSTWGFTTNTILVIIFGLAAYNIYAQRWSAKSGKYSTKGRITWSGEVPGAKPPYLVSYSYNVDGALYNGELYVPPFRVKKTIESNPKGKEVIVYYANKDHGFSQANKPPSHFQIIGKSILQYLILPMVFINLISMYFYWLVDVSK